jgi:hypothetical protein
MAAYNMAANCQFLLVQIIQNEGRRESEVTQERWDINRFFIKSSMLSYKEHVTFIKQK